MLNFKNKKEITDKLKKKFKTALSVVVASINGVASNSINQLRKEARNSGVYIRVVPNSLLHRAIKQTPYECLSSIFIENSIVAFSSKRASDAARIFVQFSKDHENFKIKGAAFDNKLIKLDQIDILSRLPNYQESIIQFILILQISSVGKLINILKILSNQECKL